jgi:hypothetical protein
MQFIVDFIYKNERLLVEADIAFLLSFGLFALVFASERAKFLVRQSRRFSSWTEKEKKFQYRGFLFMFLLLGVILVGKGTFILVHFLRGDLMFFGVSIAAK